MNRSCRALMTAAAAYGLFMHMGEAEAADKAIREVRKVSVGGELGWNSLAGVGPTMSVHLHPHFSLDGALGLSSVGYKIGARARINMLKSNFTPFVAAGMNVGAGTLGADFPLEDPDTNETLRIKTGLSTFAQAVAGIEFIADGGFVFSAELGYAKLIGDDNVEVVSGRASEDAQKVMDIAYRSGPVLSLSFGYAFGG